MRGLRPGGPRRPPAQSTPGGLGRPPRRSGTPPYTSQDIARLVGRRIQDVEPGARVDLDDPDVEIHIEVRENRSYLFTAISGGPGGLPMGSQGRVLAVVDSEAGAGGGGRPGGGAGGGA